MKAVVMEMNNNICSVLCDDGAFRKLKGSYEIGQEIDVVPGKRNYCLPLGKKTKQRSYTGYIAGLAAAAVLFLAVGSYETVFAYSYVTLDVNPSIEYTLNRLNRVIKVSALNEDASTIVESLNSSVRLNTLSDAVSKTIDTLQEYEYLIEDDSSVLVDVVSGSDSVTELLTSSVTTSVEDYDNITVSIITSDENDRAAANENGISTGRYEAMKLSEEKETDTKSTEAPEDLQEYDSEEKIDRYRHMSVKEIVSEIEASNNVDDIENSSIESNNKLELENESGNEGQSNPEVPEGIVKPEGYNSENEQDNSSKESTTEKWQNKTQENATDTVPSDGSQTTPSGPSTQTPFGNNNLENEFGSEYPQEYDTDTYPDQSTVPQGNQSQDFSPHKN